MGKNRESKTRKAFVNGGNETSQIVNLNKYSENKTSQFTIVNWIEQSERTNIVFVFGSAVLTVFGRLSYSLIYTKVLLLSNFLLIDS